ncbi:FAST kinase domain-containing protein 4 [Folsomia candida]|nr:FAST kinase domain-containing protein 4 [Folsomia candida]
MHYQPIHRCCWGFLRNSRAATALSLLRQRQPRVQTLRRKDFLLSREFHSTREVCSFSTSATTLKFKEGQEVVVNLARNEGMRSTDVKVGDHIFLEEDNSSTTNLPAVVQGTIYACNSAEELLKISSRQSLLLKHACLILHRLGQLSENDKSPKFDLLLKDERFVKMCNLIQRADYSHNPHLLFAALHGLQKLGALESSEIYQKLYMELKWGMRRCQIRYLIRSIAMFAHTIVQPSPGNKSTDAVALSDSKIDIVELAIHTIQRRWVEIVSGQDFNSSFKIFQFLDEETRGKLEDRAVEMVPTFTPSEMRQLFVSIAGQKRRPTPLLRTLAFHFAKCVDSSSAKDLIELIYALNELTFADPVLMENILSNLCPEVPTIQNPALISSLVTSIGQIRYKHKAIMRILNEWMVQHVKILRPFDCAAWLLTCAVLNHSTENTKMLCEHFKAVLSPKTSSGHVEWINIVHSLLVHNSHTNELLASVLSPEVITSIENMGLKSSKSKIKLLNINATARHQAKSGYKGPFLTEKTESQWASTNLSTSDKKLAGIALDTMSSFLSPEKYLTLNQKLPCGVFADAICMLNKNKEPVSHMESKRNKTTPYQPAALVIEGYAAMTLGCKEPTGQTVLNRSLLEKEGYIVITIPYTELSQSEKLIKRAKYLEQKLKGITDSITSA